MRLENQFREPLTAGKTTIGSKPMVKPHLGPQSRLKTSVTKKRIRQRRACPFCFRKFEIRRYGDREKKFCSPDHRVLFWTVRKAFIEFKAGRAPGLADLIAALIRELLEIKK